MSFTTTETPAESDRMQLNRLLSERNRYPERAEAIDKLITQRFSRNIAILALDMCGFSRLTVSHGVIHFLAMVHQMHQGACPAIEGNGGTLVKQEADNLFAMFDTPQQAIEAALDIQRAFDAMNAVLPQERAIAVSIGIGYGETLVIDEHDMFGPEMNFACKLGEDVAGRMEILLTAAAHVALPPQRYALTQYDVALGSLRLPYHRFERCLYTRPENRA